jgi:hypothetical protein
MENLLFDEEALKLAIADLKASTRVTMETVGVRFGRRVSTSVYRANLLRVPGNKTPALHGAQLWRLAFRP